MSQLAQHPEMPADIGVAMLRLDAASGTILSANPAATERLGEDVTGKPWRDVMPIQDPLPALLSDALSAAMAVLLPPALLTLATGAETVIACQVIPERHTDTCLLVLDELWGKSPKRLPDDVRAPDVIAVLGVDGLAIGAAGLGEVAGTMREIRAGLEQILRQQDWAGAPAGTTIPLALRETDREMAVEIGRALLSHLRPLLADKSSARVRIGLAAVGEHASPMAALVAANQALLAGQGRGESVTLAEEGDLAFLAGRAVSAFGAFGYPLPGGGPVGASEATSTPALPPPVANLETGIDGYVDDNMEGAIDQARFLAGVDMPIAIIGTRGTGKLYIARIIHQEAGGQPDTLVTLDCREMRGRQSALRHIAAALDGEAGRTLVFKSPQLLHPEVQRKLARQLASRVLADTEPPRYLPAGHYVGLFPDTLDRLAGRGELDPSLAGVFGGYPIRVPPLRERGRAVLRWAHKILGQEAAQRDRRVRGLTRDAEQAILQHDWPGNISELRQAISNALDHTDKEWITPVDLGLFAREDRALDRSSPAAVQPFLQMEASPVEEETYLPSTLEQLDLALAEAVNALLELDVIKPLGAWLDDEVVLAACKRYRGNTAKAAGFLHTKSRNVGRWLPKIEARENERSSSRLWQEPRRLVQQWIGEVSPQDVSPQQIAQDLLLARVMRQCGDLKTAARAKIMGVSPPTYQKRVDAVEQRGATKESA